MSEVVDAEVVEEGQELVHQPSAALFKTDDPVEVVSKATEVANALTNVIEGKKLYQQIQGKKHILVDGWQLLGGMLGVTAVCVATEPVDGGYKATVEARTADGRVVGRADALCTKHEKRGPWKGADDYARLSMAQTRATSKALKGPLGFVVSLAGYAPTPAEEMTFMEPDKTGDAPSPAAPREGSDVPSEAQEKFLMTLLGRQEVSPNDQELIRDWASKSLSRRECSKALEGLKTPATAEEWRKNLLKDAKEWAAKQTDLPADTDGLGE